MRGTPQRRIGFTLIVLSAIAGMACFVLGFPLITSESRTLSAGPTGGVTATHIEARWPLILVIGLAVVGLILMLRSRGKNQMC